MDAVLQAVDAAQRMMAELYANAPLVPASPELLMQLHALVGKTAPVVAVAAPVAAGSSDTISDDEFEALRSEEHTSELQSLMRISYAVFCLKKKTAITNDKRHSK